MLEGLSVPLLLKACAATVVIGGAGVATVEVISSDSDATTVLADVPAAVGFAEDANVELAVEPKEQEDRVENASPTPAEVTETKEPVDPGKEEAKDDAEVEDKTDEVEEKGEDDKDENAIPVEVAILWPEDGSHHEKPNIVFEGKASVGAKVAAGPYEATVDDEGHWRIELVLGPGANKAVITATDADGNVAEDSVTAWLDVEDKPVEKEDKKKDEPANVGFSAKQQYGSCAEPVPYDVFWGTATPNTVVQISSAYGSATVEVGKEGHWEKKVWFETAPRGQAFAVTVTADNGSKTFEFLAKVLDESHGESEKK